MRIDGPGCISADFKADDLAKTLLTKDEFKTYKKNKDVAVLQAAAVPTALLLAIQSKPVPLQSVSYETSADKKNIRFMACVNTADEVARKALDIRNDYNDILSLVIYRAGRSDSSAQVSFFMTIGDDNYYAFMKGQK